MIAVKKREDVQEVQAEAKQDAFVDRFVEEDKNYMSAREHEEIVLDPKKYILSKTDAKGVIEYGNEYFVEISGYKEEELIGKPHNIVRHPDMPKIIFKFLWQRLQNDENIIAVVKNRAKDGRFYWVMTDFEIKKDPVTNQITSYFAYRKAAPRKAIEAIEPLYKKLCDIEKVSGMDGSYKYLVALLEAQGKTYDQFIDEITGRNGIMKMWFAAMKKFFS
jgi:PAS domain S-box-containing protein